MKKNRTVNNICNSPQDDEAIGRMSAWLVKNKMIGQTTLAGKLTLTPKEEAYTAMLFGEHNGSAQGTGRTKGSL